MPAKNDMEILMQQKMEEFRIEPSPADWQAIYERLHPKKDRRFFWWWFPLVAGLLFGGFWIAFQNQSSVPNAETAELPSAKSPVSSNLPENQADQVKDPVNSSQVNTKPANEKSGQLIISSTKSYTGEEQNINSDDAEQPHTSFSKKLTLTAEGPDFNSSSSLLPSTHHENSAEKDGPSSSSVTQEQSPDFTNSITAESKLDLIPAARVIGYIEHEIKQIQEENKETTSSRQDSLSAPVQPIDQALKKNSIPNISNHANKGWYLGAYAEIGLNNPTEPISMMKAADLNSFPGSGGSTTTSDGSTTNGLHYALGLALERKLKKMSFSFGLGIQSNTWSSTSTTYKDSIVGGIFFNRTQISNNSSNYTHIAMELPVMLNFRISGKKHSSYWLTTGLNNAITLKLNQRTDVSLLQGNTTYSQDNSLTSKASSYQPQFRIGFMYENTQDRYHWQLTPFLQYGLNSMVKTGSADTHLLHFGIQTRYYFRKLK